MNTFRNDQQQLIFDVISHPHEYTIDVNNNYLKSSAALAEAIEVGDKIRFRVDNFSSDRIGWVPSNEIQVVGK